MSYIFTDYNDMVGKRPRQLYWKELQDAINDMNERIKKELSSSSINTSSYMGATVPIYKYPRGITVFEVSENTSTGYPSLDGVVETIYIDEFRNIQHFFEHQAGEKPGETYYRQWKEEFGQWSPWIKIITSEDFDLLQTELKSHIENKDIHLTELDRKQLAGYVYTQNTPLSTWNITHSLNKYPSVSVTGFDGIEVFGDAQYISLNQVKITFTTPFAGRAYLS